MGSGETKAEAPVHTLSDYLPVRLHDCHCATNLKARTFPETRPQRVLGSIRIVLPLPRITYFRSQSRMNLFFFLKLTGQVKARQSLSKRF